MPRFVRVILSVLLALSLSGAAAPARAREPVEPAPSVALHPNDAPSLGPEARADVPPVPSTYVTRDLGWLRLSYPPAAEERVASILEAADGIKAELSSTFGVPVLDHVEVRITPTVADMADLAPVGAPPPAYASGVAYPRLNLVLISMLVPRGGDAVDVDEVFRHELAHIALEDAVLGRHVPVWFNEGLAIGLSGENKFDREKTLWTATLSDTLLPFSELDERMPESNAKVGIAYAESADFMRFLMQKTDAMRFRAMIHRVREGHAFERAMTDAYGSDLRKLEFQWRTEVDRRYSVIPVLTGGGILWVAVVGGLFFAYAKKRRRTKEILARWEREEALEDALVARRAAELETLGVAPAVHALPIKIEHDGHWHTLH